MKEIWKKLTTRVKPTDHTTKSITGTFEPAEVPQYQNPEYAKFWDRIMYAFTSGGKNYFCFSAEINIPIERMLAAKAIFEEIDMRINPDILVHALSEITNTVYNSKKGVDAKMKEIARLTLLLQEKVQIQTSPAIDFKLASVVYFDEVENPFGYDHHYAMKKIQHWMSNQDLPAFFLTTPNNRLVPGGVELQKISQDFLSLMSAEAEATLMLLNTLIPSASGNSMKPESDTSKTLHLQKAWAEIFKASATLPLTSST